MGEIARDSAKATAVAECIDHLRSVGDAYRRLSKGAVAIDQTTYRAKAEAVDALIKDFDRKRLALLELDAGAE